MTDETTELQSILDEYEHECFMLRVEATETRARDDVVRKSYERIHDEFAGRIAAMLGNPEIARCSDCEFVDKPWNCAAPYYAEPNGFCAWAERKGVE